ncbi:hypothetical protein MRB53_031669 [Persea americana]|uniref:Uncharacterized protein n=1 Tax=Persea americana TaxID=3435 RepID=A0ACC2KQ41_PERAE|nr:hypothetical protein MRB53_031669 [Persea americana]
MPNSPPSKQTHLLQTPKNQSQQQEKDEQTQQNHHFHHPHHLCDVCNESIPLLYCRADTARLCFSCDRSVHSDNPLFSKHQRNHLCNACEANPASIFCSTHNLFLCQNCDWDAHDGLPPAHDRRPLEGFSGCPSAIEFASALGVDEKGLLGEDDGEDWVDGVLDGWVWETAAPVISLDDLIVPTTALDGSCHSFQAVGVSPPLKRRNVACGKYKEEILQQLRDLVKTETPNDECETLDAVHGLQYLVPEQNIQPQDLSTEHENDAVPILVPCNEASAVQWHDNSHEATDPVAFSYKNYLENTIEENSSVVDGYTNVHGSETHTNEDKKEIISCFEEIPRLQPRAYELTGHDRDMVILRYKEKKKTRRYDKHIRYESRKARADSRIRVKGRFAKVTQDQKVDSVERQV